jgi:alginate O-acetyltransferase complex protein AlgI
MVFSRLFFLYLFLPLCIFIYAAVGSIKRKNTVLIIFSLIFYAWGEPTYVFLMLLSALVNYGAALLIDKFRGRKPDSIATFAAVFYNILMLGVFKYSGFIVENINAAFSLSLNVPDIALPIGISFYTFQNISYVVDCHWEKIDTQKSFKNYLVYLALFAQLVAGPIVRYSTIESEIENRKTTVKDISYGLNRIILGLSKKVLLANQLSLIVDEMLGGIEKSSVFGAWYGALAYGLQIYFDFSGYSDIAIGLGRIFGFHFDENFKHPFICKDITEFWQRWHISLSTFFRDYVLYIPIFGKRRKYGGIFLVWLCTGIWHGASWNYIIWGLYYGLFILLEMKIGKKNMKKIPVVIRHIYNKIVIILGFGIFYFEDLGQLGTFFKKCFGFSSTGFIRLTEKISVVNNMYLLILAVICCFPIIEGIKKLMEKSFTVKATAYAVASVACAALLIISSIMLVDSTTNPFLYFRF